MDVKDYVKTFWAKIENGLTKKGITMTELAQDLGFKRETIYTQKGRNQLPKSEQLLAMLDYLEISLPNETSYSPMEEFIPYLEKADEATLKSVRKLLDMPTEADKENTFRLPSSIMVG